MIEYIIQQVHTWQSSRGEIITMISFFQSRSKLFGMKTFTTKSEEAKKFDCKSEASRYITKNFTNSRTSQYSVKKIES